MHCSGDVAEDEEIDATDIKGSRGGIAPGAVRAAAVTCESCSEGSHTLSRGLLLLPSMICSL